MGVKVQIYCRQPTLGEMQILHEIGTHNLAWDVDPKSGDAIVRSKLISNFCRDVKSTSVLLIHSSKLSVITAVAEMVRPDYLLLSSVRNDDEMPELALRLKGVTRLMMSVPVLPVQDNSKEIDSLSLAKKYSAFAGCLILDTCPSPSRIGSFGCTGQTNDWSVCSEIVKSASLPVILAGGLNPENVKNAIETVSPYGVDACTSLELSDKSKNIERCRLFISETRG